MEGLGWLALPVSGSASKGGGWHINRHHWAGRYDRNEVIFLSFLSLYPFQPNQWGLRNMTVSPTYACIPIYSTRALACSGIQLVSGTRYGCQENAVRAVRYVMCCLHQTILGLVHDPLFIWTCTNPLTSITSVTDKLYARARESSG